MASGSGSQVPLPSLLKLTHAKRQQTRGLGLTGAFPLQNPEAPPPGPPGARHDDPQVAVTPSL